MDNRPTADGGGCTEWRCAMERQASICSPNFLRGRWRTMDAAPRPLRQAEEPQSATTTTTTIQRFDYHAARRRTAMSTLELVIFAEVLAQTVQALGIVAILFTIRKHTRKEKP